MTSDDILAAYLSTRTLDQVRRDLTARFTATERRMLAHATGNTHRSAWEAKP